MEGIASFPFLIDHLRAVFREITGVAHALYLDATLDVLEAGKLICIDVHTEASKFGERLRYVRKAPSGLANAGF